MPDDRPPRRRALRRVPALLLLAALTLPPVARADDSVNLTVCKRIISHLLCKPYSEFSYAGKPADNVYIISFFYASKQSQMLCAVLDDGQIVVQDRTWRAERWVFPYTVVGNKCISTSVTSPDCGRRKVKVCPPKTAKDVREQRQETFWNRPVPQILEQEMKGMNGHGQENATAAPAQQAPAGGQ